MSFNIQKRICSLNFKTATRCKNLLGMKTQPKKLRSFAILTSKNKKIFAVGFSLG